MCLVSAVIPYFNRQRYIGEAIGSILQQTTPPDEIIIVDDGSDKEAAGYLSRYAGRARIVRLSQNRGAAAARNAGIAAARGKWIAFLDSDDLWEPHKLETQLAYLRDNPECDGVHTALRAFFRDGRETVSSPIAARLLLRDALSENMIRVQSLLVRRSVLWSIGGFDPELRLCEDDDLGIRLAAAGYRIDFLSEPLSRLRREDHGHLFDDWTKVLRWKTQVSLKHRALLGRVLGAGAARRRVALSVRKAGLHRGHVVGRMVYGLGYVIGGLQAHTN